MWRFIQLSDLHLGGQEEAQGNNRTICSMMPSLMSCLRRDLAELKPKFILVTGDITCHESLDALFAARDLVDSLGFPYYPLGGQSDFLFEESRRWFLEAFQAQLPVRDTVYSFTHRDLHFCVLDPWWVWPDGTLCPFREEPDETRGWAIPPHQFEWLEHDLSSHRDLATAILIHYPSIPLPERMHRGNGEDMESLTNGSLLVELLQRHAQVRVLFSGHAHMHCINHVDGLTHVVTGALNEFPLEYRDIHVHDDHLEIHTRGLTDPSFAAHSLIEGNEWTAGEEGDRYAIVPL